MNRWVLPVAIALTVGLATVGAVGQSQTAAASRVATHHHAVVKSVAMHLPLAVKSQKHARKQQARHGFEAWRIWCKRHESCVRQYSWTARGNPTVRHAKWRVWCLDHQGCALAHRGLHWNYILSGPVGLEVANLPEGAWVGTFMEAAHAYGVSPQMLMGIGMVESGGGVAGTAYEGCMNYATFGSWPGQIYCAAQVLSRVGLAGYNSVNPSYGYTVMGEADGIDIIQR